MNAALAKGKDHAAAELRRLKGLYNLSTPAPSIDAPAAAAALAWLAEAGLEAIVEDAPTDWSLQTLETKPKKAALKKTAPSIDIKAAPTASSSLAVSPLLFQNKCSRLH